MRDEGEIMYIIVLLILKQKIICLFFKIILDFLKRNGKGSELDVGKLLSEGF